MITFFRANSILHILTLLLFALLIKMPFINAGLPLLNFELEALLVGERLVEGKVLYREIWTELGPLASYFYGLVHLILGKSQRYYEIVSVVVVLLQGLYFNYLCNAYKVYSERNYLPSLMYILVMSLSFDMSKMSPALLSNFFFLYLLASIFKHIEAKENRTEQVFEMGLFVGMGFLAWYPFPIFLVFVITALLVFSTITFRQVLLLFFGFIFPIFVTAIYFYFQGALFEFYAQWLLKGKNLKMQFGLAFFNDNYVFLLPILIAVLGIIKVLSSNRYNNFQNRKHQVLMLSGVFALFSIIFSDFAAPSLLTSFAPFLAFFIMAFFIHLRSGLVGELIFILLVGVILLFNRQGYADFLGEEWGSLSQQRVDVNKQKAEFKNQKILVTGPKNDYYQNASSGIAYLNWNVSKVDLTHPDYYENLNSILEKFEKEQPQFIVDEAKVFPRIFKRMPKLNEQYQIMEPGVYRLVKP